MADAENKPNASGLADERYKYIGFEVFPGKPGDIFKNDEERKSLIQKVMAKFNRSDGEVRDHCTLMEERVSGLEKGFLALASVIMILAIFLPWFSGYYEIETARLVSEQSMAAMSAEQNETNEEGTAGAAADSTVTEMTENTGEGVTAVPATVSDVTDSASLVAAEDSLMPPAVAGVVDTAAILAGEAPVPEGLRKIIAIDHDPRSKTGIGALFSLGDYGSLIFSSGFVLILSFILMLVFFLSCIVMAGFNLYVIYGSKAKNPDDYALMLKNKLKLNWIPIYIWLVVVVLSLIGASYGFDSDSMVKQVGDSYGIMTFINLGSFGIYLALAGFLITALKAKEI